MEYMKDPYSAFTELLTVTFTKLAQTLKTHDEEKRLCERATLQAKTDRSLDANRYFPIIKRSIDTKLIKTVEIGLYYIQKLISHGFLNGNCTDTCTHTQPVTLNNNRPRKLIDSIVETVCSCVYERDEVVQLQVIKTILTLVTSLQCEVHEKTLLEAFRACYHIHMTSNNIVNSMTAKGAATQMLHCVFLRMEKEECRPNEEALTSLIQKLVTNLVDDIELYYTRLEITENVPLRSVPSTLLPRNSLYTELVQVQIMNETGETSGRFGWCVECRKPAEFYCKDSKDPICSEKCKKQHGQCISAANAYLALSESESFYDSLLLLRAICRISLKGTDDDLSFIIKSKSLSLELLLSILEVPGPVCSSSPQFIEAIKTNVCECVLKNSLSSDEAIFALSLGIFATIAANFQDSLKHEIGIFLNEIFIRLLASEHTSSSKKGVIIETLHKITQDPKSTLELFLNYDCHVDSVDLFAQIIEILRKTSTGYLSENADYGLSVKALNTLSGIMVSQCNSLSAAPNLNGAVTEHLEKAKALKTQLSTAAAKFNVDPSLALTYLSETESLNPEDPAEIAVFLKTPGLSKSAIGQFLGSRKELNATVLKEYLNLFDFTASNIVNSLRNFLSGFRIPGEGQVVDRLMESFAEKYSRDNPAAFATADSAFLLAFGVILLQTDLHNPSVVQKMTLNKFSALFAHDRSLNVGLLEEVYSAVKDAPFTLEEDEEAKEKQGYSGKNKQEIQELEHSRMYVKGQGHFRMRTESSVYYTADDMAHLRTLFKSL